jgi:hypothetical protein
LAAILEISYHLLRTGRMYDELDPDYFDRRYAERLQRRCLRLLERRGVHVTVAPPRLLGDARGDLQSNPSPTRTRSSFLAQESYT